MVHINQRMDQNLIAERIWSLQDFRKMMYGEKTERNLLVHAYLILQLFLVLEAMSSASLAEVDGKPMFWHWWVAGNSGT